VFIEHVRRDGSFFIFILKVKEISRKGENKHKIKNILRQEQKH
jgi:hypothetical protein